MSADRRAGEDVTMDSRPDAEGGRMRWWNYAIAGGLTLAPFVAIYLHMVRGS